MAKTGALTKGLAIAGTLLMWFPIVGMIGASAAGTIRSGTFRLDWLIPAELFPFVLLGGALLLWAALRARARRGLVAWGLGFMIATLVLGQVIAMATGLASGESQPETAVLPWALVVGSIALYICAVVEVGVAGVLLIRDLFRKAGAEEVVPVA